MPLGMDSSGPPGQESGEVSFDLSETGDQQNTQGVEASTVEKNEAGEIEVNVDGVKETTKAEEGKLPEPEGLTAIPTPEEKLINSDNSSLTEIPIEQQQTTAVDDQAVLSFLNEKYGAEYKDLDEATKGTPSEDPFKDDPYMKGLVDWQKKTGRPIEDYAKYQKDYSEMSDQRVVREYLQHKYPTLNDSELNIEMNKYTANELDDDSDVATKNLELKKLSTSARSELESLKGNFGEPTAQVNNTIPADVQKNLDILQEVKDKYDESQRKQAEYSENIKSVAERTLVLPLKLSDELSLNFNINEQGRNDIPDFVSGNPHLKNEDGSWNHQEIVNNSIKVKNFDRIIQLVYEQGLSSGKDEIIEASKNSTLGTTTTQGGSSLEGKKGPQIEGRGLDNFMGKTGMTIKLKS